MHARAAAGAQSWRFAKLCLRHIANTAPAFLAPGGWLIVEHGNDQGEAVRNLFAHARLSDIQTHQDLSRHDRVCQGKRAS